MPVKRTNIDKCIGCQTCLNICPMDVFRFNYDENKSVIAYPENCQQCGQCWVSCPANILYIDGSQYAYGMPSWR